MAGDHHVVPMKTFVNVYWALVVLTVLTVVTAKYIDLGAFAILTAFGIATAKGFLVMAYFMHLKYDEKIYRWIIISSFFFVGLLFIICAMDIATRLFRGGPL